MESLRGKRYSGVRAGMDKGGWPWGRKYPAPGAAGAAGSKPLATLYRYNHSPLLPSGLGGLAAHPSLLGPGKSLGSGELLMGKRNGGEGREVGHKSAVNLLEGLWGQEIHWGLGDQEDPRDRDGVSEGSTGSGRMNMGDRASKPHSPSLRVARGDHHHLMFPVGVNRQGVRWTFIRHCPKEDSGQGGNAQGPASGDGHSRIESTHLSARLPSGTSRSPLTPRALGRQKRER